MFKLIKLIKDFDKRLTKIEKSLESVDKTQNTDTSCSSYREVIDEWLNGKKG